MYLQNIEDSRFYVFVIIFLLCTYFTQLVKMFSIKFELILVGNNFSNLFSVIDSSEVYLFHNYKLFTCMHTIVFVPSLLLD